MSKPEPMLYIGDANGIYIPQQFGRSIDGEDVILLGEVDPESLEILRAGPDHEHYLEAWADIEEHGIVTDSMLGGTRYRIHNDGDCWLIPEGMEWDENEDKWIWPVNDTEKGNQ